MADIRNIRPNGITPQKCIRIVNGEKVEVKKAYKVFNGQPVIVWDTSDYHLIMILNVPDNYSLTFTPNISAQGIINWGDGVEEEIHEYEYGQHTFQRAGLYTISFKYTNPNLSHVSVLQERAFTGLPIQKIVKFPGFIIEVQSSCFENCTELELERLPEKVVSIHSGAFKNCLSIKKIDISSVTYLGGDAFSGCENMTEIDISSVRNLNAGYFTFQNCKSLKKIAMPEAVDDGSNVGEGYFLGCSSLETITLPQGSARIEEMAFKDCTSLKQIELTERCYAVSSEAFMNCSSLESMIFPENCHSIRESSFYGCTSLRKIEIKHEYIVVEGYAFANSGLEEIEFHGTIDHWQWSVMESNTTWNQGCGEIVVHCSDGDIIVPANI